MASENKLQDIIQTSLESLRTLVDSNTVIGDPILTASGTTIIPVSKISMGYATGGLDYNAKASAGKQNFGGGGGTGLTITPVGFLAVKTDGSVEMIKVSPTPAGTIEQIADVIERSPEIFAKLKDFFTKGKKKKETAADDAKKEGTKEDADGATIEVNITAEDDN